MLADALFVPSEDLTYLLGFVGEYVGFGVGLALSFWMLGYVVSFIVDVTKGG